MYALGLITRTLDVSLSYRHVAYGPCNHPVSVRAGLFVSLAGIFFFGGRFPKYVNSQKNAEHVSQNGRL